MTLAVEPTTETMLFRQAFESKCKTNSAAAGASRKGTAQLSEGFECARRGLSSLKIVRKDCKVETNW